LRIFKSRAGQLWPRLSGRGCVLGLIGLGESAGEGSGSPGSPGTGMALSSGDRGP
jgi:hypothetical protein